MIARIWHGWTSKNNSDAYENLLREEIFKGIEGKNINGYKGIQLLRKENGGETEFITIMWFDSVENVKQFAGEEYTRAVVPENARGILTRFDEHSVHYEVKEKLYY